MKKKYLIICSFIILSVGVVAQQGTFSFWNEQLVFLKAFIKNPSEVGALMECSPFVGKEISKHIKKYIKNNPKQPIRVLEVGAGTGALTKEIMGRLREIDHLDAIEISPQLCKVLKARVGQNKNISICCTSILDWKPPYSYDFIVSTLPFNSLEIPFVLKILNHYYQIIKSGGVLSYVEYIALSKMKKFCLWGEDREKHTNKRKIMKSFRKKFGLDTKIIWLNLPLPIHVYHLKINQEEKDPKS